MCKIIAAKREWFTPVIESSYNSNGDEYPNCHGLRTTGPEDKKAQFYTFYRNARFKSIEELANYMMTVRGAGYGQVIFGPVINKKLNSKANIGIYALGKDWKAISFKENFSGPFTDSDILEKSKINWDANYDSVLNYLRQRIIIQQDGETTFYPI